MENLLLVLVLFTTICLQTPQVKMFFTDLRRNHILFSLATLIVDAFVIFERTVAGEIEQCSKNDLGQLWLDGKPSTRKFLQSENPKTRRYSITERIFLFQEQVTFGWLFDRQQSFIGLLTDVHMWDNMQSSCEIQRYTNHTILTPGNVLNWGALDFRVLLENKQSD
uniref:Pentraxin family member n=1 Tax=Oncorhynchus mykiss TaxID=8022 RepID=A0A8C7Q2W2_ONCMY